MDEIMKSINQKINNFDDGNDDDNNDYDSNGDDGNDEIEDMYIEDDYLDETEYVKKRKWKESNGQCKNN